MRRVLVVCTANQCRSPMAEGLARDRADRGDARLEVTSAGTRALEGLPPTDQAVTAMAERDIDISGIRSREVTAELLGRSDLVLVMTTGHKEALAAEFPDVRERLMLMSELGGGRWDVADPVGGALEDYRATADEIDRLLAAGWSVLVGAGGESA